MMTYRDHTCTRENMENIVNEIKDTPEKQKVETKKPAKKPIVKKKKKFDDILEEAAKMVKEDKKDNKILLKAYNDSIKSLSKEELKAMVDYVKKDYTPKPDSLLWAKKVIGESKSVKSKLLMYCNEIRK